MTQTGKGKRRLVGRSGSCDDDIDLAWLRLHGPAQAVRRAFMGVEYPLSTSFLEVLGSIPVFY